MTSYFPKDQVHQYASHHTMYKSYGSIHNLNPDSIEALHLFVEQDFIVVMFLDFEEQRVNFGMVKY